MPGGHDARTLALNCKEKVSTLFRERDATAKLEEGRSHQAQRRSSTLCLLRRRRGVPASWMARWSARRALR